MHWHKALTDQLCMTVWMDWRNRATFLLVFYKHILLIGHPLLHDRPQKPNAMCVTVLLPSSNGEQYIPCLLIVSPGISLKWCSQCFNNLSGIYPYILLLLSIQSKTNMRKVVNQSSICCTLPSLLPRPAKTLLHDAFGFRHPFLQLLNKKTHFISL